MNDPYKLNARSLPIDTPVGHVVFQVMPRYYFGNEIRDDDAVSRREYLFTRHPIEMNEGNVSATNCHSVGKTLKPNATSKNPSAPIDMIEDFTENRARDEVCQK